MHFPLFPILYLLGTRNRLLPCASVAFSALRAAVDPQERANLLRVKNVCHQLAHRVYPSTLHATDVECYAKSIAKTRRYATLIRSGLQVARYLHTNGCDSMLPPLL